MMVKTSFIADKQIRNVREKITVEVAIHSQCVVRISCVFKQAPSDAIAPAVFKNTNFKDRRKQKLTSLFNNMISSGNRKLTNSATSKMPWVASSLISSG